MFGKLYQAWWNIHPANNPLVHQKAIRDINRIANEIFK